MNISGQPIELRNDQGRLGLLGGSNGGRELRAVGPLAALDFAEIRNKLAGVSRQMPHDGVALGVQAKTAPALTIGRNPEVGDKPTCHSALRNRQTTVCMLQEAYSMSTL